jgi:hypothetical protein
MLRKILTGGQSAAERAAREAASRLGIYHGAAAPDSEALKPPPSRPEASGDGSPGPDARVPTADGLLIITEGNLDSALNRIHSRVRKNQRPCLHIDFQKTPAFQASTQIAEWITRHRIEILYVTGSDTSVNQKIYEKTYHVITSAYWLMQDGVQNIGRPPPLFPRPGDRRPAGPGLPVDVMDAVHRLTAEMPLKDRTTLSNMTENELYTLNFTLGSYIRNHFGIWTGNTALMDSCRRISDNPSLHEKDASSVIIRELWKYLKSTHKLRVIK